MDSYSVNCGFSKDSERNCEGNVKKEIAVI